MRRTGLFFLIVIVVLSSQLLTVGCANIIPPLGGPRDSLPPVLVSSTPKDSTLNFKGNRITLTFDEYIDLQNVQENLLFNPQFESVPVIEARLKTLTLRIRDTLEPNTTYSFNFGNAVQDVNEHNPYKNFTYTFSTGPYFDSLQLSGRVILAENGKIDSTLTIVLHSDMADSAVVNKRPRYATRVDSTGRFVFKNLPAKTYAIYAIGDAGTMRRYTSPNQYFAFADSPVVAGSDRPITLYAYKEEERDTKRTASTGANAGGGTRGGPAPTDKRLRLATSLANNQQDLLSDLQITTERSLLDFDSTKIRLTTDSTFTPVAAYTVALDSTKRSVHINTAWQSGARYNLIIDKDFAVDTVGRKLLKTDTITFTARKREDYGRLQLRMRNIDAALNPVLQFVQSEKVVFSTPIGSGSFTRELFLPGDYDLRILYDRNGNGVWDAGNFFEGKRQPEIVQPIDRKITLKPSWENEFEVVVPPLNGATQSP